MIPTTRDGFDLWENKGTVRSVFLLEVCGSANVQRIVSMYGPWPSEKGLSACTLTNALDTVSHPAFSAAAFEASRDIQTGGVHVTVMGTNFTLVHI